MRKGWGGEAVGFKAQACAGGAQGACAGPAVAGATSRVASAQVKDCSIGAPERGTSRTATRTGAKPGGRKTSPSTCWKYLNE